MSDVRHVARGTHTQLLERSDTYRKLVQALKIEGSGKTALPTSVPEPAIGPTPRRHTGRD